MILRAEILSRYAVEHPASELVYAPVSDAVRFRESRVYQLEMEGDSMAAKDFVREVLCDAVSQELHFSDSPHLDGASYILDVAMKPKVLDLEKQYLLKYYRTLENPGFDLRDLTIRRRIYIFGDAELLPSNRLQKDVVNPVIQIGELVSSA